MHHFMGYGFGGVWSWQFIAMGLARLAIIIGVIIVVVKLIKRGSHANIGHHENDRAIQILRERFATGEITDEEYNDKIKRLKN